MRQAKSFIEVLEEQIREDLREEIRAEVEAEFRTGQAAPAAGHAKAAPGEISETWLAANVSKSVFQRAKSATGFYRQAASPAPRHEPPPRQETSVKVPPPTQEPATAAKPEPVRMRVVTAEEIFAVELIERTSGSKIGLVFSEPELKSAWRKAALRTHPDRHTTSDRTTQIRMGEAFAQLAIAYDTLTRLFN